MKKTAAMFFLILLTVSTYGSVPEARYKSH
jgi:hypothetical protein